MRVLNTGLPNCQPRAGSLGHRVPLPSHHVYVNRKRQTTNKLGEFALQEISFCLFCRLNRYIVGFPSILLMRSPFVFRYRIWVSGIASCSFFLVWWSVWKYCHNFGVQSKKVVTDEHKIMTDNHSGGAQNLHLPRRLNSLRQRGEEINEH